MPLDTTPLLKILELEQKKGYTDTAVFGGLDRFLKNWGEAAAASIPSRKTLSRFRNLLVKTNYAKLTPLERQEWVDKVRVFLPTLTAKNTEKLEKAIPAAKKAPSKTTVKAVSTQPIDASITVVKGVSGKLAEKFAKLGVRTIRDLLYFFPNRHIDYSQRQLISQLQEGLEQTIVAIVWEAREKKLGGSSRLSTEATVGDETGNIGIVWFNNPWMAKTLKTNSQVAISGRVKSFRGRLVFENPEWEIIEDQELIHAGRLVPQYHLTEGLHPRQVRKLMKTVVDQWAGQLEGFLPSDLKRRNNLLPLTEAINQAHFPDDTDSKDKARVRLAFDELFLLQLGVLRRKRNWQASQPGNALNIDKSLLGVFIKSLPFELTPAQQRVVREILADIAKPQAMSRLLQGEVGSGKTVVATIALLIAVANGFQGALMAPTEILAEQHFNTLSTLLEKAGKMQSSDSYIRSYTGLRQLPVTVALLTGALTLKKKQLLQEWVRNGDIDMVIGTHALIQEDVTFKKLGLAVVDEQHRFGVEQRSVLRQKGFNPHVLVMTATPIPRTLALTLYGDLDLSVIDQLPPGRQEIKTRWLKPEQRNSAYRFIAKQVAEGRQAFIICPLIEESDAVQAKAATEEYEHLSRDVFPDLKLGLLHGRMSNDNKNSIMHSFNRGELQILVATPVIEVGIDVPNASVMLVESADRFGLSQLHQFRGRVGRGQAQSYCMFLAEDPSEIGRLRLDIIEKTQNGFVLAEEDLKLRGPGEFFGTRQSGIPDLKMAKISDVGILELARREATNLFSNDPTLARAEHALLVKELTRVWPKAGEWS
ncbi:MAG: ATP-dependent DNA helicase RecG [Dehalococcoidales bacterium]|nr:ATP-dependent DNA helicase RecG [Dehalococcoidales bacterium]